MAWMPRRLRKLVTVAEAPPLPGCVPNGTRELLTSAGTMLPAAEAASGPAPSLAEFAPLPWEPRVSEENT